MLRFFRSITADDAQQQSAAALKHSAEQQREASHLQQKAELLKRGPGRPKKLTDAHHVLAMAAAAAPPKEEAAAEPAQKRGKYANWFASVYIHDILHAVQRTGSARKAVEWLQHSFPKLPTESAARFTDLSESTVRSWYKDGKLLPKFQQLLDEQKAAAPRGVWRERALAAHPAAEERVKQTLRTMRERGASVNILVIRHVMRAIFQADCSTLLDTLKLSHGFVSSWAREELQYSWRTRTTAASKLPIDWRNQGIDMAKRIAYNIQVYKVRKNAVCCMPLVSVLSSADISWSCSHLQVHPSLVINMDQTGAHLVPSDTHTYEVKGAKDVKVIGADDKRQITVCIASSLHGDLLPLQLIFQGKTTACHPDRTPAATAARVHITHSENHWSNQETMQQYIREVIVPYSEQRIAEHNLPADSHICLVLDVWSVHKSEEFRFFLRTHFPRIHLVYVPPNCTSQLQVADVILQRPFKHGLRRRFSDWAGEIIREQIDDGDIFGLTPYLKMSSIKPLILQWCIDSWSKMKDGRDYIKMGWHSCCVSLFDVHDQAKRVAVVEAASRDEFVAKAFVPDGEEGKEDDCQAEAESDHEEDEGKDELDIMKERQFGIRKSARKRAQASAFGFQLNSSQLALTSDSEA